MFRAKSMPMSKFIQIVRPTYETLQIIPHSSTRNYNSSDIAKMVASMYKKITNSIRFAERKLMIETSVKCSYVIDMYKDKVNFYFVVPQQYKYIAKEKILSVWGRSTIKEGATIDRFKDNVTAYQMAYKKLDGFSLDVDRRSNNTLHSMLNVIDVMQDTDRVTVLYNFMPQSQYGWNASCKNDIEKYQTNGATNKNIGVYHVWFGFLKILGDIIGGILDGLGSKAREGSPLDKLTNYLDQNKVELSPLTRKKRLDTMIGSQIAIVSTSTDKQRSLNNAVAVCQSYRTIDGDNEFIYKKAKTKQIDYSSYKLKGIEVNKTSLTECHNFLQLPGRDILSQHKIEHVNVLESEVPEKLREGVMCMGESTLQGHKQKAYLSTDFAFQFLTVCLIGPTRSGKTTLISNMCNDSKDETNIIFDWCGNADLSNDVIKSLGDTRALIVDCSDAGNIQGLGYNELYTSNEDVFQAYRSAKQQATQLMTLINATQGGDEDLRARMERYLGSAALVVGINRGAVKDVFAVLQNHEVRKQYIDMIPSNQLENLVEYVQYLNELDDISKDGEVKGTKLSAVQGILNRINKLKENAYLEMMLKKDCSSNFNLVDEMQKGQLICLKMPERMFLTEQEKDTYATYWMTKVWGALQQRLWKFESKENEMIKVNLYFDELYQVKSCQEFLKKKLSQSAKFMAKPIISCHYLGQIGNIRNELKSANSSYILISGTDKDNYNELKHELDPYTLDDVLNLKRYHALNLIKYEDGWGKFITKLPKPL